MFLKELAGRFVRSNGGGVPISDALFSGVVQRCGWSLKGCCGKAENRMKAAGRFCEIPVPIIDSSMQTELKTDNAKINPQKYLRHNASEDISSIKISSITI
jgi:hypothetical protein